MLLYAFERMRTIAYASNSTIQLIRDKRANCEPLHRHDYYEMIYSYEGESIHVINDVSYRLGEGDLIFLTPNDTHSFFTTSKVSLVNICFVHKEGLSCMPVSSFNNPIARLDPQSRIVMESLLYLAEQELNLNDSYSVTAADRCLDWILLLFQRNNSDLSSHDPLWGNLLTEIAKHYDSITLEQAARIVGVSVSHFCRIFRRDFSMTFHAYLNIVRIRQAKNLLLLSDEPINSIAEQVGFPNNPCRFYSNFKSVVGMTPTDFRKKSKQKADLGGVLSRSFIPEPTGTLPDDFSIRKS